MKIFFNFTLQYTSQCLTQRHPEEAPRAALQRRYSFIKLLKILKKTNDIRSKNMDYLEKNYDRKKFSDNKKFGIKIKGDIFPNSSNCIISSSNFFFKFFSWETFKAMSDRRFSDFRRRFSAAICKFSELDLNFLVLFRDCFV